jgi:hypothetical protein
MISGMTSTLEEVHMVYLSTTVCRKIPTTEVSNKRRALRRRKIKVRTILP